MSRLSNIRVAIRLPFVSILSLAALIIFALVALTTLGDVRIGGARQQSIAQSRLVVADIAPAQANLLGTDRILLQLTREVEHGDTAAATAHLRELEESIASFESRHEHWQTTLAAESELRASLAEVHDSGQAYLDLVRTQLVPAVQAGDAEAVMAMEQPLEAAFDAHAAVVDQTLTQANDAIAEITEEAVSHASGRQSMLWVLLVVTLLVVGAAAFVVTRSILRPLDELRRNMDDIASGDGNSTNARLDADRRDEFGQVAASFNTFADKLVAYSDEVATNARVAETRAVEVSQAATVAAENMNTVAVATTELSAAASEIARSAGDASRTAETAVRAADHANQLMERLADSSARIGEVVESIRGIAAQTTMLALNATIEAARAGEAGRGFAVVASEVKDLAGETGTATADIVGRVEAIHADTQAALTALGEVAHVITEISSSQSVIAAAVEEQAATTAEIDRSLTEAVTAVNQLAGTTHTNPTNTSPTNTNFTSAA